MYKEQGWGPWTVAKNLGIVGGGQVSTSVLSEMNRKKQTSEITKQMNFIYDALELGLMTEQEASIKLAELDSLKKSLAKAKKPKKIAFKLTPAPKLRTVKLKFGKPRKTNIKKVKMPVIKEPPKTKLVLTKSK